jgi:hypothetical protein
MRRLAVLLLSAGLSLAAAPVLACAGGPQDSARERYEDRQASGHADEGDARGGYDERRYDDQAYDDRAYDDRYDEQAYEDRYDERYDDRPPVGASPWYIDGRHPPRDCECPAGGDLQLSNSFFYDAGGVGPIPDGGWYGGGAYVVSGGYGQSFARSYASASSSASVSVRGGARYGGHGKGGYGKGGR